MIRSCGGIRPPDAGRETVSNTEAVVHVCMVTPHMPPEQAANALLPSVLAREFAQAGHRTTFLTHPAQGSPRSTAGRTVYVRRRGRGLLARSHLGAMSTAARIGVAAARAFRGVDLVHLHSNGFIVDVAGWMAARLARPAVVTLYGTDVWHFDPERHGRFEAVVRGAAQRVFYSRALRHRAVGLGLATPDAPVIYAPVDEMFQAQAHGAREAIRRMLGVSGPMLLTVKRLHPVAGYEDLLKAFAILAPRVPDARLFIAGSGELRKELERQAEAAGIAPRVRFLGLVENQDLPKYYAAADLFVLPSRLESWGTVMLEALACGTRVVATATAGAREAHEYFDDDLRLTPLEAPEDLADAVEHALGASRRATERTLERIASTFRPGGCAQAYRAVYETALADAARRNH
jgi:glycosyltransferase involved in cell wall biosynthesis